MVHKVYNMLSGKIAKDLSCEASCQALGGYKAVCTDTQSPPHTLL